MASNKKYRTVNGIKLAKEIDHNTYIKIRSKDNTVKAIKELGLALDRNWVKMVKDAVVVLGFSMILYSFNTVYTVYLILKTLA